MQVVFRKKLLLSALVGLLPLSGMQAMAAVKEVEEIVVSIQRKEATAWESSAKIEMLTSEELVKLQPGNMADLVRYLPSISFEQSNDRRGNGSFLIRGLGGNRVIMLLDGARLPDGFGSGGFTNGRNSFEAYSLGDVQFLKGPSSALYGSDAMAGVVLLNSTHARYFMNEEKNPVISLSAGYDSVNQGKRQTVNYATPAGNGELLIQASMRQFEETDIYGDFENIPMQGDQQNLLMRWESGYETPNHYGVIMDYWEREVEADFSAGLDPAGDIISQQTEDKSYRWRLGFHQNLSDFAGLERLAWQADMQRARIDEDEYAWRAEGGSNIVDIEEIDIDQDLASFSVIGEKHFNFNQVVFGLDLVRKEIGRINYYRDENLDTGQVNPARNGVIYPVRSYPLSETDLIGAYLQDEISMLDNKLKLTLGLRYDWFRNSPTPDILYSNSNPTGEVVGEYKDDNVSPSASLYYEMTDAVVMYANYTTGFRVPPITQQYINTLIQSFGFPHEILANPDLTSETSEGYELGLKMRNSWGSAELAYFDSHYEDFIESLRSGTRPNPVPGFRPVTQLRYENLEEVDISGVELEAELNLSYWLNTDSEIDLVFSYIKMDGDNRLSDEPLTSVGPQQTLLGLHYTHANNNFSAQLYARHMASFDDVSLDTFVIPSYTKLDLSVAYQFSPKFDINLRVDNILDKQYWPQYLAGTTVRNDMGASAAPGRSFSLSANYRFEL